jgi:hypothetical protein
LKLWKKGKLNREMIGKYGRKVSWIENNMEIMVYLLFFRLFHIFSLFDLEFFIKVGSIVNWSEKYGRKKVE